MPRRSSVRSSDLTLVPSIVMSPSVIEMRRLTIFIAVVLPPPGRADEDADLARGMVSERSSIAGSGFFP